jgi:hypothetical protein
MSTSFSRRGFAASSVAAGTGLLFGSVLPSDFTGRAAASTVGPGDIVRLRSEIEPLVRLIEETPRQRLLEEVGARIRAGLGYQQLLAALFLAGVRNVEPRPSVGFKFHAVLVVNSAHLASLSSSGGDRWLPIFWALDEFKSSQARDVREGNWTMAPVDESAVPDVQRVRGVFHNAMQDWDVPLADGAAAGVARYVGAAETLELFAMYAARDFRSIGHKAIFLANAWRTLQTIGWRFAEPVLRSLAYAMLNHNGEPNPSTSDLEPDRAWRRNQPLAEKVRAGWLTGELNDGAASELVTTLRTGSDRDVARQVLEQLNAGVAPQSIWDAMHIAAGELLMRQPGIVALHAVTTTNANRFLFDQVGTEKTRLLLTLQNASFLPMFREAMRGRGTVSDSFITDLQAAPAAGDSAEAVAAIFETASRDRIAAANGILSYLDAGHDAEQLLAGARRLIFAKGNDSHDYKFSSAALEDYYKVSPAWRNQFLATSIFRLKAAGDRDNGLVERIRASLA